MTKLDIASIAVVFTLPEQHTANLEKNRMKTMRCPNCSKPTVMLWVPRGQSGRLACQDCASGQPQDAALCFLPEQRPDRTWADGPDANFQTLHDFLNACFDGKSELPVTKDVPVLEALVKKLSAFATVGLAPWIKLAGKPEYEPINSRNFAIWTAQKRLNEFHAGIPMVQVNWTLLKPDGSGKIDAVGSLRKKLTGRKERMDWSRITTITNADPDVGYEGKASFEGYCAFVFLRYSVAFLESPIVGNALYVMHSDRWREFSQLSKTTLLRLHESEIERILHTDHAHLRRLKRAYSYIFC